MAKPDTSVSEIYHLSFRRTPSASTCVGLNVRIKQKLLGLSAELEAWRYGSEGFTAPLTISQEEDEILGKAVLILRRFGVRTGKV